MEIRNTPYIPSAGSLQSPVKAAAEHLNSVHSSVTPRDSVMFSAEALRRSEVSAGSESPKIRFDLINRIKSEIAAGTYDTPEKMDIAIERMASRIF